MTDKEKIDVTKCLHFDKSDIPNGCTCYWDGECNHYCYYKQLKRKEQECEKLKKQVEIFTRQLEKANREVIKEKEKNATQRQENGKLKQTLDEIIRFFKEDEKFARYSGRPIIFAKPTLEKIEKILKENDIKIS